jgi:hypothetical protein
MRDGRVLRVLAAVLSVFLCSQEVRAKVYRNEGTWAMSMAASKAAMEGGEIPGRAERAAAEFMRDYPIETDWMLQDFGLDASRWFVRGGYAAAIEKVLDEADDEGLRGRLQILKGSGSRGDDTEWLGLYEQACRKRRAVRLKRLLDERARIVFTKHFNMGGSHYAYTEAQSDAQAERSFRGGTSLCILEMDSLSGNVRTLIDDPEGVIRDPDVSFDGERILFSWKKSDRQDDYHLYEIEVDSGEIRQITSGPGFADYEGAYLPDGDIVFNSTRCVQTVDCWWTEVSNLYRCDADGRFLRRLSFDQVHTNYPAVLEDGRVIYTRWDYNDRGQIFPQPLYQMNPDGTAQREFYGNNSWFPTTILHARGIGGTQKVIAIATGHHSRQTGKLIIIDPAKGRQENSGVQLIAPVRPTHADRIDAYGQEGELFQYPFALSEMEYVVTYSPHGWTHDQPVFGIYHMTIDGRRELLAFDGSISCNQAVVLKSRNAGRQMPSMVDYSKSEGTYYIHDVYRGEGLKGVPRGTVRKLRVVEIQYRAAGIRSNHNGGPAGGALVSTPIAIDNGCWDVKVVLGDAAVYADGSACFTVPARTPVYFQAIDERGRAVQSMRTWSTLQPGETLSCVGCHEGKNEAPAAGSRSTIAMTKGPQELSPFYGSPRGFSFNREIQPILDNHCIGCHNDRSSRRASGQIRASESTDEAKKAFSLLGAPNVDDAAGRVWSDSYLALTSSGDPQAGPVRWLNVQSVPPVLAPYYAGSAGSPLVEMLRAGHNGVVLSTEEMEKICCWIDLLVPFCGDYIEANCWTPEELDKYLRYQKKCDAMAGVELQNIRAFGKVNSLMGPFLGGTN